MKKEVKAVTRVANRAAVVTSRSPAPVPKKIGVPQNSMNAVKTKMAASGLSNGMLSLALPGEVDPVRSSDAGSTTKTAIVSTFQRREQQFLVGSGVGIVMGQKDAPLNAFISTRKNVSAQEHALWFENDTAGIAPARKYNVRLGYDHYLPFVRASLGDVDTGATDQYAWTMSGNPNEPRRLWFDAGAKVKIRVEIGAIAGTVTWSITPQFFDGKADSTLSSWRNASTSSGTFNNEWTLAKSGYYCFAAIIDSVTPSTLLPTTSTVQISGIWTEPAGNSLLLQFEPFFGVPGIANEIEGSRSNALAILVTNTTPELYRGGQIAGFQSAAGQCFAHYILTSDGVLTSDFYGEVATQANAVSLDAATGMYGYNKPTSSIEYFSFLESFKTVSDSSSVIASSYAPIMSHSGIVMIGFELALPAAGTPELVITMYSTLEFMTDVQTRERRPSQTTPEAFARELDQLRTAPQFMENPRHVKELVSSFASGRRAFLKEVRGTSKDVHRTIQAVSPRLGAFIKAILG